MSKLKKVLSTMTAFVLTATLTMPFFANAEEHIKGDINNDGIVNGTDSLLILEYYSYVALGKPTEELSEIENILLYGDVNNDGLINSDDASEILIIGIDLLDPNQDGTIDMYDMKYIQNTAYNIEDYSLEELQDIVSRTVMQPDTVDYYYYGGEFGELKNFFLEYAKLLMKHFEFGVGDVNQDGIINASDSSEILSIYSALSSGQQANFNSDIYDFNGDGKVNSSDASEVISFYAEISSGN